ncbi:MAG: ribosome maturation factor RimM [Oscillospiraceae bacterium]|nr:ribosome maturation factor RimM [Oscillospiraceae bacterium]
MSKTDYLECGKIVNTHGIRGEVKIVPWADSPEFVCGLPALYLDGKRLAVRSARVHKGNVIALLEGVDDVNAAMLLKNKVVSMAREDADLPEGSFFLSDIIGLRVIDEEGRELGTLKEILSPSLQQVYVVEGEREILIPAVPQFILETNTEDGYIKVRLIDGM